jgi:hypothetical protein
MQDNPRVVAWYEEMSRQLRREAQGVPMQSSQYTMMERIAFLYAKMRYQELNEIVVPERERQATQDSWQKAIDQFNRLLEKNNDKIIQDKIVQVQDIVKNVLNLVESQEERQFLRRRLNEEFANLEL